MNTELTEATRSELEKKVEAGIFVHKEIELQGSIRAIEVTTLLLGLKNMMVAIGWCLVILGVSVHGSVGRDGRDCCSSMR
jgi:hypothetical protein